MLGIRKDDAARQIEKMFLAARHLLLQRGQRVLIAGHGNSLRALVKHLDHISDEDIPELNIPTGIPLVYELDEDMKALRHYYLGDQAAAEAKAAEVARQAQVKK